MPALPEILDEAAPEFLYRFLPGKLAFFDFVEFVFETRGKADVENIVEAFHQQVAHFFAQQSRE